MKGFQVLSAAEQVASHLREQLERGTWVGLMPGEDRLMARLGIGRNTIKAALRLLEEDGFIESQGTGRQRRITLPSSARPPALRVAILLYESSDRELHLENLLRQRLLDAGHTPAFSEKSLTSLGMKPERIARHVAETEADAWVLSAASAEVLQWFASRPTPAFSLFGRFTGIDIAAAAARKSPTMCDLVRRLVTLGHRRIVMLSREERVQPTPALFEQSFLDTLHDCGIPTSRFNLPLWKPEPKGLHRCLDTLFQHTPPTALYIEEPHFFTATRQYLAHKGVLAPRDLSLICGDPDPSFAWCKPTVTHLRWDSRRLVQRVVHWANQIAAGKEDRRQVLVKAELVEGGTIGPTPAGR